MIISQTHEYLSQIALNTILGKIKFLRNNNLERYSVGEKNPHFMYAIKWQLKFISHINRTCIDMIY